VTALVVNRVQPRFASDELLDTLPDPGPTGDGDTPLGQLIDNLRGYTAASDREEQTYADLVAKVAPAPVYRVPLLNGDVHDLDGLGTIADLLFGGAGTGPPAAAGSVGGPAGER
jgi:hypothetical protein